MGRDSYRHWFLRDVVLNNRGYSLISIMVAASIGIVILLSFSSLISSQFSQVRNLRQQLAVRDLKASIGLAYLNSQVCTCQMAGRTFSRQNPNAEIAFNNLRSGCDAAAPVLAAVGNTLPGETGGLQVQSIRMLNFRQAQNNEWVANLEVAFDPRTTVVPVRPVRVPQRLRISPGGGPASIVSCMSSDTGYELTDRIAACNAKGLIYNPQDDDADDEGCIPAASAPGSVVGGWAESWTLPSGGAQGDGRSMSTWGICEGLIINKVEMSKWECGVQGADSQIPVYCSSGLCILREP